MGVEASPNRLKESRSVKTGAWVEQDRTGWAPVMRDRLGSPVRHPAQGPEPGWQGGCCAAESKAVQERVGADPSHRHITINVNVTSFVHIGTSAP